MTAHVYIGIVSYNSRPDLPTCIEALRQQTYSAYSITILDNASQDESVAWIEKFAPEIKLIRGTENLGFGRGHNRILAGLELKPTDYYLPLNPDVRLKPQYIEKLLFGLETYQAGWGTGKLLLEDEKHIYSMGHALGRDGYAVNIGYGLPDGPFSSDSREIFGAPGAAPLISQQVIADVGGLFDPAMFMYNEDVDLDWRARRLGWRCWYIAEAIAIHRGSQPSSYFRTMALGNRFLGVLKNAYWYDLLIYNAPLILLHCLARLIVSPRQGLWLCKHVIRHFLPMLRQRRPPRLPRKEMMIWFKGAKSASTAQPIKLWERLVSYFAKR